MLPLPTKDWGSKEKRIENVSQIPKRLVHQQTSPMNPTMEFEPNGNQIKLNTIAPSKSLLPTTLTKKLNNEALNRRRNMSKISEDDGEIIEETRHTIQHFPNLVDSVHIAENRMNQKKPIKYIFPTTYIGTLQKSQESVNNVNNKPIKKNRNVSGIPIPKNGFNSKRTLPQKLIKKEILEQNSVETNSAQDNSNSTPSAITPPSEGDAQISQIQEDGKIYK